MSDADASTSLPAFARPTNDASVKLAATTAGLVTKAEFARRREELEHKADEKEGGETRKKKKKKGKAGGAVLSFGNEDGEDEEAADKLLPKRPKLYKNPSVDSSFLPDKERDEALARRREELAEEYKKVHDAIKAEMIEVTYSYHDPSGRDGIRGHRNTVTLPKGATMQEFLNKCREQQVALRSCSAADLMYVKEDLIMPHGVTFYELILTKARGKSGPLFHFDVHDDVRVGAVDHRVEKDESHAGKVMEKRVYERNKDRFPYSRFEVYDPSIKWDEYTTHGHETRGEGINTALL
jgi:protein FAM50